MRHAAPAPTGQPYEIEHRQQTSWEEGSRNEPPALAPAWRAPSVANAWAGRDPQSWGQRRERRTEGQEGDYGHDGDEPQRWVEAPQARLAGDSR